MRCLIKNGAIRAKAFKVYGGLEVVEAGKTKEIDLHPELSGDKIAWFKEQGVVITPLGEPKADGSLVAEHRGRGVYAVMRGGEVVKEDLSKEDAEAFNAMSEEDKAAYVEV